jgi:hypothetical protein
MNYIFHFLDSPLEFMHCFLISIFRVRNRQRKLEQQMDFNHFDLGEEKMDGFGNSRYVFVEFLGEISFLRPPRTLMRS